MCNAGSRACWDGWTPVPTPRKLCANPLARLCKRCLCNASRAASGNLLWLAPPEKVADFRQRLDAIKPGIKLAVSMRVEKDMHAKAVAIRDAGADQLLLMNYVDANTAVVNLRRFAKEVAPALAVA